ncbi:kinase-like domain-containing protein [Dichotomocladium elegans]|nr:kinase-like domain-containing protein [Dichotomocladium elegans]
MHQQPMSASTPAAANRDGLRQSCSDSASAKKPASAIAPLKRRSTDTVKLHRQKHHEKIDLPRTRYHGFQEIGTGVNGSVMQVRVSGQSRGIALKRCKLDQDREYRAAVVRELLIMASGHANIIKLGEASVYKNEVWMGMDLMQSSVFAVLCSCALPEEYAIFIARQTLNALAFLHSKGFFHRDVKCENLLIGYHGEVKLADFGLAASKRRQNQDRLGTAKWMAPEVIKECPYDEKVDLWSLGITIIEMMDRVPPHYAVKNDDEVFDLVLSSPSPSFTYSQPTIYCTGLVAWLLEMNPENRPTAKDVIAEIDLHIEQNLLKTADASSLVAFANKALA